MSRPHTQPVLRAVPEPPLPVERLILGKPVEEAADLLPRLFNLCRVAQGTAARAAFGLPIAPTWQRDLRAEMLADHVAKLCLKWPALLALPPLPLPHDWRSGGADLRRALFGEDAPLPATPDAFTDFLNRPLGVAPVLRSIQACFAPFEAHRDPLPVPSVDDFFSDGLRENSIAGGWSDHPVLADIEARSGRGPFWSAVALAVEVDALLAGRLPQATFLPGCAIIPAARGRYGVRARIVNGRVTAFRRKTPTDHLLAEGGVLDQCLSRLPRAPRATALAPLVLAILDPCQPVALRPHPGKEHADA